jgi:hypothetical protein
MKQKLKLPTDRAILECIYEKYKHSFAAYEDQPNRSSKVYVPIECKAIAEELHTERDIIFGRLYYHLEHKYGYKQENGSRVYFFTLGVGTDPRCVNFPLLASVLAGMQEDQRRHLSATSIAVGAGLISLFSLGVSIAQLVNAA